MRTSLGIILPLESGPLERWYQYFHLGARKRILVEREKEINRACIGLRAPIRACISPQQSIHWPTHQQRMHQPARFGGTGRGRECMTQKTHTPGRSIQRMRACALHGGDIHLTGVADPQRGRAWSSAGLSVVRIAKNDVKHGSRTHWCKHGTVLLHSHSGQRDCFARSFSVAVGPHSRPLKHIASPSSLHLPLFVFF